MFVLLSNFCNSEENGVAAVTVAGEEEREKRERNHTWRYRRSRSLTHMRSASLFRALCKQAPLFFCPPVTSHVETASQHSAAEQGREGARPPYRDAGGLQQQP